MCLAQGHNAETLVGSNPRPLCLESSTLPLSHCTPYTINMWLWCGGKTVWILISWLHQKQADRDQHCLKNKLLHLLCRGKTVWILISWLHQKQADRDQHCLKNKLLHLLCRGKTVWILISWLHQKQADRDQHCLKNKLLHLLCSDEASWSGYYPDLLNTVFQKKKLHNFVIVLHTVS